MNRHSIVALCLLTAAIVAPVAAEGTHPDTNTIVLTEMGVANLRIETAEAEETDFEDTIFSLGRIEEIPERHATVSSRISGRIAAIETKTGDLVQQEQLLLKVESRQPGNPPPQIGLASPIGGMVMRSNVRLGDPVEPDSRLLEITDLSEMLAVARVPEHLAARLAPGAKAHIRVAALGSRTLEGEMIRLGTAADRDSGTIDAVFSIANPELLMRPDMRAEFSIVTAKRAGVQSVPRSALQGDVSSRFVYVKHFDLKNAFIKTPVQVGATNDRMVEIVAGLLPGDEVVTQGAYSLSFAGGGSISLKEALDAAHGHEHAEDGSELTPEKKAELEAKHRAATGQAPAQSGGGGNPVWMYISITLALLLVATLFTKRKPHGSDGGGEIRGGEPQPDTH